MREETLNPVSHDQVGKVVQDYANSGAREVRAVQNADGTWKVTARFD